MPSYALACLPRFPRNRRVRDKDADRVGAEGQGGLPGDASDGRPIAPGRRRARHHRRQHLRAPPLQARQPQGPAQRRRAGHLAARPLAPWHSLSSGYMQL